MSRIFAFLSVLLTAFNGGQALAQPQLTELEETSQRLASEEYTLIDQLQDVLERPSSVEDKAKACLLLAKHVALAEHITESIVDELVESIKIEQEKKIRLVGVPDQIQVVHPCWRALIKIGPPAMDDLLIFALNTEDEEAKILALEAYDSIRNEQNGELGEAVSQVEVSPAENRDEVLDVIWKSDSERVLEDLAIKLRKASSIEEMDHLINQADKEREIDLGRVANLLGDPTVSHEAKIRACYILGRHRGGIPALLESIDLDAGPVGEIGYIPKWFRYPCSDALFYNGESSVHHLVNFIAGTEDTHARKLAADTLKSIKLCCWESFFERQVAGHEGDEARRLTEALEYLRSGERPASFSAPPEPENDRDD